LGSGAAIVVSGSKETPPPPPPPLLSTTQVPTRMSSPAHFPAPVRCISRGKHPQASGEGWRGSGRPRKEQGQRGGESPGQVSSTGKQPAPARQGVTVAVQLFPHHVCVCSTTRMGGGVEARHELTKRRALAAASANFLQFSPHFVCLCQALEVRGHDDLQLHANARTQGKPSRTAVERRCVHWGRAVASGWVRRGSLPLACQHATHTSRTRSAAVGCVLMNARSST
jgi:hypothetical protein